MTGGCTFVSKATDFNGVPGSSGQPIEYYSATRVGLHFLFVFPLIGDISVEKTIVDLTAKVKEDGGKNVRIVQSSGSVLWYVFLPLSIFVHPVTASVSAEVEVGPEAASTEAAGS
jgi:hypothetical protein